jgi:Protein of unknown function (DUF2778)
MPHFCTYCAARRWDILWGRDAAKRGWMTYSTAANVRLRRSALLARPIACVLAAFALASGAAAWWADPAISSSDATQPEDTPSFFDSRSFGDASQSFAPDSTPLPVRSLSSELEIKLQLAKGLLAAKLRSGASQETSSVEKPTMKIAIAVPLPRARPAEASIDMQSSRSPQADDRTLLQKFTDLFPARITLASLAPDGGFLGEGPDLSSLGYDSLTAVYDIAAHIVFMPNGAKLEAHSGFGNLKDDPGHVSEPNVGATPPAVYDLKARQPVFHGVQALRMIPVEGETTFGRAGLLAHSYMLGPNGDSNGCVSIKDYEKFLKAFQNGEIKRLVVVPSLSEVPRRPLLKS